MGLAQDEPRRSFPLLLLVFAAGFTFLIYEVSWQRLLALGLGATVTAATVVLATFMAGFGLGALFWGRRADGSGRTHLLLAFLLTGIGAFGAVDYWFFARVIPGLYATLASPLVLALAVVSLLAPTFLMGGVFPVASKLAAARGGSLAVTLGRLYAVETLGSTIGGLLTGFVLLGQLGQRLTVALAVAVNLLSVLLLLATRSFANPPDPAPPPGTEKAPDAAATATSHRRPALVGAFACGFASLGLQVLWIRIFRIYLTNTSYTFALVTSVVIAGLFAGSWLYARRAPHLADQRRSLLTVLLMLAATTGLGLVLLVRLPDILMFPFQQFLEQPFARVLLLPLAAALLVVFPPAICSGYAFPLTCRMVATGRAGLGRDVGLVMAVNTAGAVVGPAVAAFLLLPLLGAALSILLVTGMLVAAALSVLHRLEPPRRSEVGIAVLYSLVALVLVTVIWRPAIRILPPSFARFDRQVLHYRETVEGTLSVGQDRNSRTESKYTFVNNSAVIGSTYDAVKVVKMVGHFPFLLGCQAREVLVIGFGIGVTTSAIAAHPEVTSLDCVELVAGLKDAAVYYRDLNHDIMRDPRLRLIAGDGRHHLLATSRTYDLISCDPTHPILGSGNLYTADYFQLCRDHLNPGGMVSQYLPLHKLRTEEFLGIIRTFQSVFPHSTVWLGHQHAVLLGGTGPLRVDFADWHARVDALGADEHFYVDAHHLAATLVLDGEAIGRLGSEVRLNTDDRSYTEFFDPACLDEGNLAVNLRFLSENRVALNTVFSDIADDRLLARYVRGNELLSESLYHTLSGEAARGLSLLREACRVNPENKEYPFLIRLNY